MFQKQFHLEEEEGPEEVCMIDNLVEEHCDKKMLEDLNESLGDLDEGLLEPSDLLATLPPLKMREEILPLFNGRRHKKLLRRIEVCIPGREQAEPCCYFFISYHYSGGLST
ncbi:hypothetical protein AAG906_008142 [Vitis piasezkii]